LLYKSKDSLITIKLCDFTKDEKEDFFDVKYTRNANKISFQHVGITYRSNGHLNSKYIRESDFKIVVEENGLETDTQNEKIYEILDFAFKIISGNGFDFMQFIPNSKDDSFSGIKTFATRFLSRRKLTFDKDSLKRIKKLIRILFESEKEEVKNLNFFLDAAMRFQPLNISGAFFVTILENIFVGEMTELSYRLSMRLAKKRKEGQEYVEKIKKLYKKRSKIFHGKSYAFTLEDVNFLETEACYAIEEFLIEPESFEIVNLDKNLLA